MNTALLHNGKIITAAEYIPEKHGLRILCIDCKTTVIHVKGNETTIPYFKTIGKTEQSRHTESCGFFKPLSFEESIQKVSEYQSDLMDKGLQETVIRLNMSKLDPDYEAKSTEREDIEKKPKNPNEVKVKQESNTPNSIGTLKAVVKLITDYEPDILATILVSIKGKKIPLSNIVISSDKAHDLAWSGQADDSLSYFVFGTIQKVIRREKVYYLNFKPLDNKVVFSLVVFEKYFKHFTFSDEQLVGKRVLAYGYKLKKNEFKGKNTSELVIKSNKYLEMLPK